MTVQGKCCAAHLFRQGNKVSGKLSELPKVTWKVEPHLMHPTPFRRSITSQESWPALLGWPEDMGLAVARMCTPSGYNVPGTLKYKDLHRVVLFLPLLKH